MENFLNKKSPTEISQLIAFNLKERRKKLKISQEELAKKSGVSLGSIKRFESKYEIALSSLIKIATALGMESDFAELFAQKTYSSIDEVINE
ncbi:helix-turn-helix transcriptional regulator [bacterium]|nr:helix-turn-helix transcriptional regulator [bacterium]